MIYPSRWCDEEVLWEVERFQFVKYQWSPRPTEGTFDVKVDHNTVFLLLPCLRYPVFKLDNWLWSTVAMREATLVRMKMAVTDEMVEESLRNQLIQ
ncbi:hypothetical protein AVEN_96719-1 [Araneus ventricosus]|uniref:Uncharacterized protein n=1 Tax=Araneus ventricosus TaxID=182803 RepID=A0A4Y2E9Z7_ARAVE|nr:hypothetical protein AVEN_96719-1 [Araneus ventricosus]